MAGYVTFDEVREGLHNISDAAYPDLRLSLAAAISRVRVQVGTFPPRRNPDDTPNEDGEYLASIIRDLAQGSFLVRRASNSALVEKGRAMREQANTDLSIWTDNSDTIGADPDTGDDTLVGGGVDFFSAGDYVTAGRRILPIHRDEGD